MDKRDGDLLNDTQEAEYEEAIKETKYGKFHFYLLVLCGLIYLNTAISITIISFVLPSAGKDFMMTSVDKGWLTVTQMLGMILGSYFWGCLADTKGRKLVLISSLLLDGISGLLSSISQVFGLFMFFRFITGFAVTGSMGIVFPYLGEFQPTKYREKILCWMEVFWTIGIIVLPIIAWIIIPLDINLKFCDNFKFHSWNLFVAICAIPSILIAVWLFFFPESPKYLIEAGETDEALRVLKEIYHINTGNSREDYPIKSLKEKEFEKNSNQRTRALTLRKPKHVKILLGEIWEQTKTLLTKAPHIKNTALTCAIQFGLTSSYYTLMIWFPELFYRFEQYENEHPGEDASVCIVSSILVKKENLYESDIKNEVYLHTIIIGLACIPTSFCLPLFVNRIGAKLFIVASLNIAGLVTIGLYFVTNSFQNLVLSCIFEALTSLGISTVYCVMVDLFPTNLRVMSAALALTFGRTGALLGNLLFGFLIDLNCIIPIAIFSAMLFISGFLAFFLPSTGRSALE